MKKYPYSDVLPLFLNRSDKSMIDMIEEISSTGKFTTIA
jgi:hypothetical protein